MSYPQKSRSNAWYLLPIFVGMIGGIIAYLVIRKDDPHKAKNCIYIGIVMMVIGIIFNIMLLGVDVVTNPGFNVNL
jgi:cytochrome bd-type quinol oxidase subunit 1